MASKVATYQGPGFSFFIQNSGLRSLRDRTLLYFEETFSRNAEVREKLFKLVNLYAARCGESLKRTRRRSKKPISASISTA